jgi:hypothetical protein
MTQKNITRSDVEALENATSILQREEQKIKGTISQEDLARIFFNFFFYAVFSN